MKNTFALFLLVVSIKLNAQTHSPDLSNLKIWHVINRSAETIGGNGSKGIFLNAARGDGAMMLKDYQFFAGTIEADIRGKDAPSASFVGIIFNLQPDSAYEAIYFRPFNILNSDTLRQYRSVQYISMPNFPWEKLRATSPGKYEGKISSVTDPNDWFHIRIVINGEKVAAYVNNDTQACLEVERLTKHANGAIGLWVGNNSSGGFANLRITPKQQ